MADTEDGSGRDGGPFNKIRRRLLRPLPLSNGEAKRVEASETVVAEGDQGRKYSRPPDGLSLLDVLGLIHRGTLGLLLRNNAGPSVRTDRPQTRPRGSGHGDGVRPHH
jgi:hypothetical protein